MADQNPPDLQDRLDQFSQRGKSKRRGNSLGVGALAGKEQMLQAGRVVLFEERGVRIGPLDRAERCRRGEQDLHLVLGNDPPEKRNGFLEKTRWFFNSGKTCL